MGLEDDQLADVAQVSSPDAVMVQGAGVTAQAALPDGRGLWAVVVPIFGPSVLFGMTEGAIFPVVALSAIDRGASTAVAALIAALVGIGSILSNIPASRLAERLGERRAMLAGAGVSVAGLLLCLAGGGLLPLAAGVLLLGVASSVFQLARQMYLTEAPPPHLRARALSTLGGTIRRERYAVRGVTLAWLAGRHLAVL